MEIVRADRHDHSLAPAITWYKLYSTKLP